MIDSSNNKRLFVATGNKGKLKEIRNILRGVEVFGLCDIDTPVEIIEDGDTFEANAFKKANTLMQILKVPVLADDSGLEVDALNGEPGVYSARYAGEDATDDENTNKLLKELENVPQEDRTARFVCVMCLVMPNGEKYTVRAETEGIILAEPRGVNGFGYDPVFYSNTYNKSFAELNLEEKNAISHRGKALAGMSEIFDKVLL